MVLFRGKQLVPLNENQLSLERLRGGLVGIYQQSRLCLFSFFCVCNSASGFLLPGCFFVVSHDEL